MQKPLQITMRDMQHSAQVDEHIREKASKLEDGFGRIIGCHVTVERIGRHQHQGQLFSVHIRVNLPRSEIVVSRKENENIYLALRDAFDAARRSLDDYAQKHHDKATCEHVPHLSDPNETS